MTTMTISIERKGNTHTVTLDAADYFAFVHGTKWGISDCSRHHGGAKYYARKNIGPRTARKTVYLHRLIMGVTEKEIVVDHVDNNSLNNVKSNLRCVTHIENAKKQSHPNRRNGRG